MAITFLGGMVNLFLVSIDTKFLLGRKLFADHPLIQTRVLKPDNTFLGDMVNLMVIGEH